jgi:hypothetical protein
VERRRKIGILNLIVFHNNGSKETRPLSGAFRERFIKGNIRADNRERKPNMNKMEKHSIEENAQK